MAAISTKANNTKGLYSYEAFIRVSCNKSLLRLKANELLSLPLFSLPSKAEK